MCQQLGDEKGTTRLSTCHLNTLFTDNRRSNFGRLVLLCIDSYDCEKRRILQHFSRSTRLAFLCTSPNWNFVNFRTISHFCCDFYEKFQNFSEILANLSFFVECFTEFCRNRVKFQINAEATAFWRKLPEILRSFAPK